MPAMGRHKKARPGSGAGKIEDAGEISAEVIVAIHTARLGWADGDHRRAQQVRARTLEAYASHEPRA